MADHEKAVGSADEPQALYKQTAEKDCEPTDQRKTSYKPTGEQIQAPSSHTGNERQSLDCPKSEIVTWDGPDDNSNPMNMSQARKALITAIICFGALNVTCTSVIYSSAYEKIMVHFNTTRTIALVGITVYLIGIGFGPMLYSPLSEFYGRRYIYIISFAFFFAFQFPVAFGQNISSILINRFLSGLAGSAFMSVSGGTVADLYPKEQIGIPMMAFTLTPFLGPVIGPVIGNFIVANCDWRWVFYVMIIWTGAMLLFVVAFVPETFAPAILTQKAKRLRRQTGNEFLMSLSEKQNADANRNLRQALVFSIKRPFQLILFDFMILVMCIYSMILLGILYLSFEAFPLVYKYNHGFKTQYIGLTFLGLMVGQILASSSSPYWTKLYIKLEKRAGAGRPEFRLPQAIVGSILCPISMFWFGFTTYKQVHWIVPIIATIPLGGGMLLIFAGVFTYKVEAYKPYSASALAANAFFRCTFGSVFPLFAVQMYDGMGYVWASFLLACLLLACVPFPYLFYKYGATLRARSKYAWAADVE